MLPLQPETKEQPRRNPGGRSATYCRGAAGPVKNRYMQNSKVPAWY